MGFFAVLPRKPLPNYGKGKSLKIQSCPHLTKKGLKMPPEKKEPVVAALESVHSALKPLSPEDRQRVLASVSALLDTPTVQGTPQRSSSLSPPKMLSTRPVGLTEIIKDKNARTNPELITLFAYYREKYENLPKFSREDIEQYFEKAHEPPPANYGRDFLVAIRNGWIHEDGPNSYITSKGIEIVEAGFGGEKSKDNLRRKPQRRAGKPKGRR